MTCDCQHPIVPVFQPKSPNLTPAEDRFTGTSRDLDAGPCNLFVLFKFLHTSRLDNHENLVLGETVPFLGVIAVCRGSDDPPLLRETADELVKLEGAKRTISASGEKKGLKWVRKA